MSKPLTKVSIGPTPDLIERRILIVRGHKVMLDSDLAELYGVNVKVLNQPVKGNLNRFPDDFILQLTTAKRDSLMSHFVTLKKEPRKRASEIHLLCLHTIRELCESRIDTLSI
jgi:hypothetical protein